MTKSKQNSKTTTTVNEVAKWRRRAETAIVLLQRAYEENHNLLHMYSNLTQLLNNATDNILDMGIQAKIGEITNTAFGQCPQCGEFHVNSSGNPGAAICDSCHKTFKSPWKDPKNAASKEEVNR